MEQGKEYQINNSTVRIVFGNILDSQAEVIVNSSGSKMTMEGGLTKAIREAGGDVIRQDAQAKLPVNVGDAVVTTAGCLRQKYVFHCITIDKSADYSNTPEGISEDDIHQYIVGHSIDKCFRLLQTMELSSIAFPAIGAGVAGIPFVKVAEMMAESIGRNLRKTNKSLYVELYLFDGYNKMGRWDFLPMFEQFSAQEAIANMMNERIYERLVVDEMMAQQTSEEKSDIDKDIFISYSRKDSDTVKQIYASLEKAGYKCWLDENGMYSGISYKKVIVDAIKRSKILLFMSSENSNKSQNVISEISIAMKYGKKIIPIRLDMSHYYESIDYDIVNHDYVVYNKSRMEESFKDLLKKLVSTLKMLNL